MTIKQHTKQASRADSDDAGTWVLRVAVPVPVRRLFDYLAPDAVAPEDLRPGIRLKVPFGRGKKIGYLVERSRVSAIDADKLKRVEAVLDNEPLLNEVDMRLLRWAGRYYHHPLGEVFSAAFPAGLRQGKPGVARAEYFYVLTSEGRSASPDLLKRAPRQKQLLQLFRSRSDGCSETELSETLDNWRPAVKALIGKHWLQVTTRANMQSSEPVSTASELTPNPAQQQAIAAVTQALGEFRVFLLEGVTGSGKTEVYMQIIRSVLAKRQQVLVLLPEITLTPQLEQRFRQRFTAPVAVTHSKLTDAQRQTAWLQMRQGDCAILLGTRSALFTPMPRPGLIILDEEHDASFKQQDGFRFSARDVAVARGKMLQVPVVLGSATPSLESCYNAEAGRYRLLHLPDRAGTAAPPSLQLLDIRNKRMTEGLSEPLLVEIRRTLARREQVLLFLNRRGFAPTLICHACGWVARCRRCDANLVIHHAEGLLRCHHCGSEQRLLRQCPACHGGQLTPLGLGTERVEQALAQLFPESIVARLDRDTTRRKGELAGYLERIRRGQIDIILGTQMLAKGHHFPEVTLAALVDVDNGLFSIDFHAPEKLAQLVVQVAGRAGRAAKPGKVILQTRQPEHPLLSILIRDGYRRFAQSALAERRTARLPPYSYQALVRVEAVAAKDALAFCQRVAALLPDAGSVEILGPVAAPMARKAGRYRYQILLQSARRAALHGLLDDVLPRIERLRQSGKVRWSLDVDPVDLY